ncbi:hypothetical protein ES708_28516 [subsurface metagenome]
MTSTTKTRLNEMRAQINYRIGNVTKSSNEAIASLQIEITHERRLADFMLAELDRELAALDFITTAPKPTTPKPTKKKAKPK